LVGGKSKSSPRLNVKGESYVTPISKEHRSLLIRILPIMVMSHLSHLYGIIPKEILVNGNYLFDVGGYFQLDGTKECHGRKSSSNTLIMVHLP